MRKILTSLLVIGVVGVGAFGASHAFFSDTETSEGNILAAGAIDLLVGNTSYVTDEDGELVESPSTSWSLRDLTVEKFFNFFDLKPGDEGENTVEIQVLDNDAYVCANVQFSDDLENGLTEPELDMDDNDDEGELDENLYFVFWADDGDNVYETNESILEQGLASNITLAGGTMTIAESPNPLAGGSTYSLGSYYCYGGAPESKNLSNETTGPDIRGSGFTCNGSGVSNDSQTDMLIGDISFYAVQARNNPGFSCSGVDVWPETPVGLRVGANLAAYSAPTQCDITVESDGSIQSAINSGSLPINGTVCVASNYTGTGDNAPIRINKNGVTVAALVRGIDLDVPVVLDNPGTTITGFDGTIAQAESGSEVAAFYVDGDADNAEISFNTILNGGAQAVLTKTSPTLSGLLIRHNVFSGTLTRKIFLNPSRNVIVENNDLLGTGVGVANDEPHNNILRYNVFSGNTEAVGYLDEANAGINNNGLLSVVFNNILSGSVNNYGSTTLNATYNYWGAGSGTQVNGGGQTGPIDFVPEATLFSEY